MKLFCDYSCAGYCLTPHPVIFDHSKSNITCEDKLAVERLITKLFIPNHVVGDAKIELKANLMYDFWRKIVIIMCHLLHLIQSSHTI